MSKYHNFSVTLTSGTRMMKMSLFLNPTKNQIATRLRLRNLKVEKQKLQYVDVDLIVELKVLVADEVGVAVVEAQVQGRNVSKMEEADLRVLVQVLYFQTQSPEMHNGMKILKCNFLIHL
ncbi:uncharacterized protein LOC142980517 [Anticarsia gemmatalis]|uniref:uncharacterized protein LOC142980517 n=1 Tax=Anticarsia gemmatalis TaxID=129554 RepID=UPI003F764415